LALGRDGSYSEPRSGLTAPVKQVLTADRGRGSGTNGPAGAWDFSTATATITLEGYQRCSQDQPSGLGAAATEQLTHTAPRKPRLGALLSSDDLGSSVERTAGLHPLWQLRLVALCWPLWGFWTGGIGAVDHGREMAVLPLVGRERELQVVGGLVDRIR
jgi:hypothetical protein